jgi:hypothetical protein
MCTNIHFIIMTVCAALTHCVISTTFKIQQQQMTLEQNSTESTWGMSEWLQIHILCARHGMCTMAWCCTGKVELQPISYQTKYFGAAKRTPHGTTKHVGRVREHGIEMILTIRHIMLHTVRIQFFRAHELVHTFDGNSCLEKLVTPYVNSHTCNKMSH